MIISRRRGVCSFKEFKLCLGLGRDEVHLAVSLFYATIDTAASVTEQDLYAMTLELRHEVAIATA